MKRQLTAMVALLISGAVAAETKPQNVTLEKLTDLFPGLKGSDEKRVHFDLDSYIALETSIDELRKLPHTISIGSNGAIKDGLDFAISGTPGNFLENDPHSYVENVGFGRIACLLPPNNKSLTGKIFLNFRRHSKTAGDSILQIHA